MTDVERDNARLVGLDGLRAVAILLVLMQHSLPGQFPGAGLIGVDVFFVLSGFLITRLLLQEWAGTGAVSFRNFYGRRFVRLLPGLVAMLAVFIATSLVFALHDMRDTALSALYAFTYTTPLALPFTEVVAPLEPMWTLATEEWFYLAWPAALVILLSRGRSHRQVLGWIVGGIVTFTLARLATFGVWEADIYFWPGSWADALLAGCALAVLLAGGMWTWRVPTWLPWLTGAYLAGLAVWSGTRFSFASFGPGLTLLWVLVVLTVMVVIQSPHSLAPRIVQTRLLVWVGQRSYGIYLLNGLFLKQDIGLPWSTTVNAAVGVALTFVAAELSWRLVEHPANMLRRHFGRPAADHDSAPI